MPLDGSGVACIYVLAFCNLVLAVVGSASLGLGMWLRFSSSTSSAFGIDSLKSFAFVTGVTVLIVVGFFTLITVVLGCYGSCAKKKRALEVYCLFLLALIVTGLVFVLLCIFKRDEVGLRIVEFYISLYVLYDGVDPVIGFTLRGIHNILHCCGVTGISLIEASCPRPDHFLEHFVMPNCPEVIIDYYGRLSPFLLAVFSAVSFLLVIPLLCCRTLCKQFPRYNVITNSALTSPQLFQQEVVLLSSSYPKSDPNLVPLITVADDPAVKA